MDPPRWWKLRRIIPRKSTSLLFLFIPILCLLLLLNVSLPEVSFSDSSNKKSYMTSRIGKKIEDVGLGEFGDMMVEMLPDDLAFTVFLPSEEAFGRSLRLRAGDSSAEQKMNNTYAIVSRVMGFSVVPQMLPYEALPFHREVSFDSISGLRLHVWKDFNRTLLVNGIKSESIDIRKGEIVIHKIGGVLMDAEFQHSFAPDDEY